MSKNVIFQTPKNYQVLRDHKQQVRVQKNPLYDYLHKSSNKSNEMEFLLPLNLEKKSWDDIIFSVIISLQKFLKLVFKKLDSMSHFLTQNGR